MAMNARSNINGNTPQDLNKMNENFMTIWQTLYGGIDFDSTNIRTQNKINTQWITIQQEDNYDLGFPTYVRFYVPPDTKKVVSSNFNFLKERYRMDSGIANGGGGMENVDIAMSMGSATGGVSSVGGGGYSDGKTTPVKHWYALLNNGYKITREPPITSINVALAGTPTASNDIDYIDGKSYNGNPITGVIQRNVTTTLGRVPYVDLAFLNHEHQIDISIPAHSHDIVLEPHSHSAMGKVSLQPHTHELNEGIKVSSQDAGSTEIVLNGQTVSSMPTGLNSINNLDLTEFIKVGEWNIIKISTNTLARMTVYGVVEVIKQ